MKSCTSAWFNELALISNSDCIFPWLDFLPRTEGYLLNHTNLAFNVLEFLVKLGSSLFWAEKDVFWVFLPSSALSLNERLDCDTLIQADNQIARLYV